MQSYITPLGLTFYIETYGCQMNSHDSEKIAGILSGMGFAPAQQKEKADLVLFNTCCVRENAENKLFGNVGKLKQWKQQSSRRMIGVCGCMMQQPGAAERLADMFPFVDLIFGTTNMQFLPQMLHEVLVERHRSLHIDPDGAAEEEVAMLRTPPPLASVNIMQGCDNFCTYCIVPYVRGREHSRPMDSIVREVESLMAQGYREVMLLGQNVNSYGKGLEGADFAKLLDAVARTGIPRIRFMTSHPKDASMEMLEQMAKHGNICKQLHLPVQAGSDRVLAAMNRRYTREQYLRLVEDVRRAVPGISLSSDIMVGFPGETEADFADTLELVREVRYDAAFTVVYSPRRGTRAAAMPDQIPEEVKQQRIVRLVELQNTMTYESNLRNVGKVETVLLEGRSTKDAQALCGRTDGGKMVNLPGAQAEIGQIVRVEIVEAKRTTLLGRMLP